MVKFHAELHYLTYMELVPGDSDPIRPESHLVKVQISEGYVLKVLQTDPKLLSRFIEYRLDGGELKEIIF